MRNEGGCPVVLIAAYIVMHNEGGCPATFFIKKTYIRGTASGLAVFQPSVGRYDGGREEQKPALHHQVLREMQAETFSLFDLILNTPKR